MVRSDSSYSWRSLYYASISHVYSGDCAISQHNASAMLRSSAHGNQHRPAHAYPVNPQNSSSSSLASTYMCHVVQSKTEHHMQDHVALHHLYLIGAMSEEMRGTKSLSRKGLIKYLTGFKKQRQSVMIGLPKAREATLASVCCILLLIALSLSFFLTFRISHTPEFLSFNSPKNKENTVTCCLLWL